MTSIILENDYLNDFYHYFGELLKLVSDGSFELVTSFKLVTSVELVSSWVMVFVHNFQSLNQVCLIFV